MNSFLVRIMPIAIAIGVSQFILVSCQDYEVDNLTEKAYRQWIDTDNDSHVDQLSCTSTAQSATLQWVCGTFPFQVQIGDTKLGQVTDPTASQADIIEQLERSDYGGNTAYGKTTSGVSVEYTKTITGWDPTDNNVTAWIWTQDADTSADPTSTQSVLWKGGDGIWVSTFPAAGDVPYIIAVDQDVNWMGEFEHIPTEWLGGDMSGNVTTTETLDD